LLRSQERETKIIALEVGKGSTGHEIASKIERREEVSDIGFVFCDSPLRLWPISVLLARARALRFSFIFAKHRCHLRFFQFLPSIRNWSLLLALFAPEVPARSANLISLKVCHFSISRALIRSLPRETSWLPLQGSFQFRHRQQSGRRLD
jgi:hypothetical protein